VSGEAILSAQNSGKPLGGQGSAPDPAGELTALPRFPSWWGGVFVAALSPRTRTPGLGLGPSVLAPQLKILGTPLS